jgi:hypothetical protein
VARERSSGTPSTEIEFSSLLDARADQVWSQVTDFSGINAELMPILRMTAPREWKDSTLEDVRPGQRLFRSWLLLFGVVPIDYDDLCIAEVGPGYRFLERSQMLSATLWEHERLVVEAASGRCRVTDRVRFTPRWTPLGPLLIWFVPRLFAHRHRRLRARFSSPGSQQACQGP